MKPTSDKSLPCALFGHNYIVTKNNIDRTSEFTCTHCNTVVTTDNYGNFETNTTSNTEIKDIMRKLYRLSRRRYPKKVAS